jgi:hypothetical protein
VAQAHASDAGPLERLADVHAASRRVAAAARGAEPSSLSAVVVLRRGWIAIGDHALANRVRRRAGAHVASRAWQNPFRRSPGPAG